MLTRLRALVPNVALSLGASAAMLLLGEAGLRLAGFSPERHRTRVRLSNVSDLRVRAGAATLDCYPSNPRGYFDLDLRDAPVQERLRGAGYRDFDVALPDSPWCLEFRYNSQGVRGPEIKARRPGVKRVVVVGDSFTEGQGVREADTYSAALGRRLESAAPGRFEVINFGERALDFPELSGLFERALRFDPDLVVYGFVLNDADRSRAFDRRWPGLNDWIMVRRPALSLRPWSSRLFAFASDRLETAGIARDTTRWYREMYDEPNREGWSRTRDHLRRMKAGLEARNGRLLVVLWPLLVDLEGRYPFEELHGRIGRVCERLGIPFTDLLELFRGQPSASLWAHPADRHPNERAHRQAAEALLPAVLALETPPAERHSIEWRAEER